MRSNVIDLKEYKNTRKHGYKINHYATSDSGWYSPYWNNGYYEKQLKAEGLSIYKRVND